MKDHIYLRNFLNIDQEVFFKQEVCNIACGNIMLKIDVVLKSIL